MAKFGGIGNKTYNDIYQSSLKETREDDSIFVLMLRHINAARSLLTQVSDAEAVKDLKQALSDIGDLITHYVDPDYEGGGNYRGEVVIESSSRGGMTRIRETTIDTIADDLAEDFENDHVGSVFIKDNFPGISKIKDAEELADYVDHTGDSPFGGWRETNEVLADEIWQRCEMLGLLDESVNKRKFSPKIR